jgi:hypothetical protein
MPGTDRNDPPYPYPPNDPEPCETPIEEPEPAQPDGPQPDDL